MNDQELTNLLNAFDKKISQLSTVNQQPISELQILKSIFALDKLRWRRIIELSFTTTVLLFLGSFLYSNCYNLSLAISAAILMFFLIIQNIGIIRQLFLISKFDYAQSVAENQAILASLQTYIVTFLGLAILQFPFFLAHIIIGFKVLFDIDIWAEGNRNWLCANLILSVIFLPISIWVYRQISVENLGREWVKSIIESAGGKKVFEAMEFLGEIEKFKNE